MARAKVQGCIFRPVVIRTRGGKRTKTRARFYWAKYVGPDGKERRHVLKLPTGRRITDKEVAAAELGKRLKRLQREAAGMIDAPMEAAWTPIRDVIAAYVKRGQRAKRNTRDHVRKTVRRLKWLCAVGGITRLGELTTDSVSRGLEGLAGRGRASKTINDYRGAMNSLCEWLVRSAKLLDRNPVASVERWASKGDVRKQRRAFTVDEFRRLLAVAREYEQRSTRGVRSLWYETKIYTGLRVNELRTLRWGDVVLDGPRPHIELRAEATKSDRADDVPLRAGLAGKLREARPPFAQDDDRVFRTTPTRGVFVRDCERAGIDRGRNDHGLYALDRHAMRKTFVSWLSVSDVNPRTTQQLARHSDMRLTMQTYTDPRLLDTQAAVERLPEIGDVEREQARATGTDDAGVVVPGVVLEVGKGGELTGNGWQNADGGGNAQVSSVAAVGSKMTGCGNTEKRVDEGIRTPDF